ncbi:gamma-glutamylcyclotransferase [Cyanistes caeruleus]|uniref:gamma-glutamylcyclotransferase n=1 Tax=Cyanistes caeruleus TaxID=156563 RepID=UPI000CDAEBAE|nr:gamma-glutamylcyclotransferase [Cyanistes caeruleus]
MIMICEKTPNYAPKIILLVGETERQPRRVGRGSSRPPQPAPARGPRPPPHPKDFKLEFGHHQGRTSSVWHGGTATIAQSPGDEVWGIVWKMNTCNLSSLDKQEGVEDGIYVPIEVNVHTQAGKVLTCRSYQMKDYVSGPPSPQYKKVICMGAKQNGLPTDYQEKLEAIETNNYAGPVPIMEEIEAAIKAEKINSA